MTTSMTSNPNEASLQSMQHQIHEKKTGILDSTRRMLGLISESEAVGNSTAMELASQHEKLKDIEKRCDNIDANLVNAQQNLNKLGSIFGGIKNYFHPPKSAFSKSVSQPQLSSADKKKQGTTQATAIAAISKRPTDLKSDTDTYFGKPRSAMDDIERETEDGLHDIHQGVNRMKLLALQMNEELESQKPLTERLGGKLEVLGNNVSQKNKDMKGILLR